MFEPFEGWKPTVEEFTMPLAKIMGQFALHVQYTRNAPLMFVFCMLLSPRLFVGEVLLPSAFRVKHPTGSYKLSFYFKFKRIYHSSLIVLFY